MRRVYNHEVFLFSPLLNHNSSSSTTKNNKEHRTLQPTTATMSNTEVLPRMNTADTNVLIVCICAMVFVVFLAGVVYCTWKPSRNVTPEPAPVELDPLHVPVNVGHGNVDRPFDGSAGTTRVTIYSDAPRRNSGTGCRLPFFQRRRETSLERNTVPLRSVPGTEHPRNNAD
ncbi:unnamed protein product [Fusarium graminearum]|nr:unnamed protein product [Fusarium graminearum]